MPAFRLHLIGAFCTCLIVLPTAPAHAQSCLTVRNACERDADTTQQRCTATCARYDNACTDTCDDGHDTTVRHCWIMQALCKERDRQAFSTSAGIDHAR